MKEKITMPQKKLWWQIIGIGLICFALGLFIGSVAEGKFGLFDELFQRDDAGIYYEIKDHDSPAVTAGYVHLETQAPSSEYSIDYNDKPSYSDSKYQIEGYLVNISERHFSSIELKFSLFDVDNNKIGDAIAKCEGLSPGQQWKFTATNTSSMASITDVRAALDTTNITF